MLALIKEYVGWLRAKDPAGASKELQQAANILNILQKWKDMKMLQWEYGAFGTLAEILNTPDAGGRKGIRSRAKPYFLMLNRTELNWKVTKRKLEPGSAACRDFIAHWSAPRLFHEGYHLLDERTNGFGESRLEELDAKKAELDFYRFLRKRHCYEDDELNGLLKMDADRLKAKIDKQYDGLRDSDRRRYDRKRIGPLIPPLLPEAPAPR
jgi:hypothetical protein